MADYGSLRYKGVSVPSRDDWGSNIDPFNIAGIRQKGFRPLPR